ncbi:DeoR/GlpR family DNA-binding transcription regulator [Prescottella equi]|uniref:DeoR family transcriptional regulator n=1 Tax=Rhodococcus hoagii TaxID=43767 RepID=A0AAE5INL6_RHOHA|nr:DeoR/GlpR family DNA-binding transcription regulator [Prescottella equi]GBF16802.1 glucitol operon repressor [Rhodococcus sp. Br-6]ERN47663.1 DeoR family transcriptional regulator [Prescottella equi NBRC 101255 = C 7]MBM4525260.1 DeoR family transcriptional regulator [Prescottella equi]MBM4627373.1 DeoR family transcriptional regulator [Prescottella equi]MBM4651064.1 DeoR family transcriptional regulator [Prescottella equi]
MTRSISESRQERLELILECLLAQPDASAQRLAAHFEVSLMTIHRDLDELQRRGVVRKFRGGVSVQRTSTYEIPATLRRLVAVPQKRAIAAAAAGFVEPGQSLLLDDSTTAATMLDYLLGIEDLHVATNYLPSLSRIAADGRASLTAIGGTYDTGHESFLGIAAVAAIRGLRVDAAFFSTSSADADGTYHQEESIVAVKAEMLRSARRRVLLMDSSKLNGTSLHLVSDWSAIDDVVTDSAAPQGLVDALRARGVSITVVSPDDGEDRDSNETNEEKQ